MSPRWSASCSRRLYAEGPESVVCIVSDAALSTGIAGAASSDGHIERFDCRTALADGSINPASINDYECLGALLALIAWTSVRVQVGARVVLFTDNSATVSWIRKGRVPARPYLKLAAAAARHSRLEPLTIVCQHVPGRKNGWPMPSRATSR
jgi:hypothetical protein